MTNTGKPFKLVKIAQTLSQSLNLMNYELSPFF